MHIFFLFLSCYFKTFYLISALVPTSPSPIEMFCLACSLKEKTKNVGKLVILRTEKKKKEKKKGVIINFSELWNVDRHPSLPPLPRSQ